jgi:hypothetical protein
MELITKSEIASTLGIDDADISTNIYSIAKAQFFTLTGLKEEATEKTYNKFVGRSTLWLALPDRNIDSIDSLTIGTTSVTISSTSVKFNPDTGLLYYSGGFSSGNLAVVEYTVSAFTADDLHNYLMILLTVRQLSLFTPNVLTQVSSFTIGKYKKTFGSAARNQDDYLVALDKSIEQAVDQINGDDGTLRLGEIA